MSVLHLEKKIQLEKENLIFSRRDNLFLYSLHSRTGTSEHASKIIPLKKLAIKCNAESSALLGFVCRERLHTHMF